jgi:hypothetical protein
LTGPRQPALNLVRMGGSALREYVLRWGLGMGFGIHSSRWQGIQELHHSPMNLAEMVFMISLVPAKMDMTRASRQAREMGYSSQYP